MASSTATTFQATRARWGIAKALYTSAMVRLRPRLMLCHISVRAMRNDNPTVSEPDGIVARVMTSEDLEQAQRSAPEHFRPDFVTAARARGDLCIAGFHGDRVVAFSWLTFSTAPAADGLWARAPRPYRYAYKGFTEAAYRGRHLRDRVSLVADAVCIDRGYTHSISFVETHNFPSISSLKRRGSVFVGYAGYLRLFGRIWPFRSPGARRHGFCFYRPDEDSPLPD